jgi:hypothetical protein
VFAIELNSAKEINHPFVKCARKLFNTNSQLGSIILNIILSLLPAKVIKHLADKQSFEWMANTTRSLIKQRKENSDENYNDFLELLINTMKEKNIDLKEEEIIGNSFSTYYLNINLI